MSNEIELSKQDAIWTLRINRPSKKNALTVEMYGALCAGLAEAERSSECRVVVVAGQPGIFTAGNDINDFMQNPPTGEDSPVFQFLQALVNFSKPLIASVDGAAVGIGTTMLAHCDFVVVAKTAKLSTPFLKLALVPEGGSSVTFPSILGLHQANRILLVGEVLSGDDAKEIGLAYASVETAELESTTLALASRLAALPPEAMVASKKLLRDPTREAILKSLSVEGSKFIERLSSDEAMQAFMGFMAKSAK